MGLVDVQGHHLEAAGVHFLSQFEDFYGSLVVGGGVLAFVTESVELLADGLQAFGDQGGVQVVALDGEIGGVESQGVMDLAVGDPGGVQNVSHGVRLREHVFDLLAGIHVPVRDLDLAHGLLVLGLQSFALTDALHDLEGVEWLHAPALQIEHDVVSGADDVAKSELQVGDEGLGVVEPDVRAVGKTGYPDEVLDVFRLGVHEHAADEVRAEFRNAQRSRVAVDVLGLDLQGLHGCEEAQHGGIVQLQLRHVGAEIVA